MTPDLDSLAIAPYVKTDDLLKASPHLAPRRPAVGITPKLTDAELVTLTVTEALLGFTSEAKRPRHARAHLRNLCPYLPQQPGCNKRLRKATELLRRITRLLATDTSVWSDDVWIVDSTPVECGRSRETVKRSELAGWAKYCYCASHSRFGRDFEHQLAERGIRLLQPTREGEPKRPGAELFTPLRQVIASVNETFKGQPGLERHHGRTPAGVVARVMQRILTLTTAIWHNDQSGQPVLRSLTAYDHQPLGVII
ncbi:IS982 family transposase [Streptomyces sp. ME19-01-6]|uniref:IS982 family transposase n=1 Tax=Streptomyces sp. ME19-01-6 TaxID=3028686 RepID=UPI0029AA08AE|nr:IS982 family transposase [Streptomyces sp. ME19-01-6]MDX3229168.1 IS982 family transposase [Streptomyces sp. ME19-01-6]